MRPKFYQGYVVLLLETTLGKFQIFVTIFAHSTTPINEVCLEPLSPSCGHGANRIPQLALCPVWLRTAVQHIPDKFLASLYLFTSKDTAKNDQNLMQSRFSQERCVIDK